MAVFALLLAVVAPVSQGQAETEFKTVTSEQLQARIERKDPFVLVDARTPEEYDEAHIVTAVSVPEKSFDKASALLPADRGTLLIIYCNGVKCGKSKKVALKAEAAGYTNILLYSEGFPVWEENAFPIKPGPGYGKKVEAAKLKPAEVDKLIREAKADYVLVDVRDDMEFGEGHIPTAINIPVEQFAARSGVLPKEKKIIVYCNTGSRSYLAYRKLIKLAYPSIYQTLFDDWKVAKLTVESVK
ncbi:MAG: rhodanese-like domain-containing protein [Geobacter sp.]|nr:rhodanese-like domain-containing protein [Geobacter sp.]